MSFGRFLKLFFGCHSKPERSFFFRGRQFPICSRCTGMAVGYIAGIILAIATKCRYRALMPVLIIPMVIDGSIQQWLHIMSNNIRRFITGISGGIAVIYMIIDFHFICVYIAEKFWSYFI